MTPGGHRRVASSAVLAAALALLALPAAARATLGVSSFSVAPQANVWTSTPEAAGGHPDFNAVFDLSDPDDDIQDFTLHFPPGLLANPLVAPFCSEQDFLDDACPAEAQIGVSSNVVTALSPVGPLTAVVDGPIFNLETKGSEVARQGTVIRPTPQLGGNLPQKEFILTEVTLPPSDYGVEAVTFDIPRTTHIIFGDFAGSDFEIKVDQIGLTLFGAAGSPPGAFMSMPTSCGMPAMGLDVFSYSDPHPGTPAASTAASFTVGDCENAPHDQSGIDVALETDRTESPSGYAVGVTFPYDSDPTHRLHAQPNRVTAVLPPGTAISPGAANILASCSDAGFALTGPDPPSCPGRSEIGEARAWTELVDGDPADSSPPEPDPLTGKVYFGQPTPADPWPLLVVVEGGGARVKLRGSATLDPQTGQVTTVFADLPQTPVTRFELSLRGGSTAILVNPPDCGDHETVGIFVPWSDVLASPIASASFTTSFAGDGSGGGCPSPKPFTPALTASTDPTQAAANTKVDFRIDRADRQRLLELIDLSMPDGLIGSLAAVPVCPKADGLAGSCGSESRIGRVRTTLGTGEAPIELPGSAYLSEAFEPGDVAGISIVVPAKVGPIDLGRSVVQSRVRLRPSGSGLDISNDVPTIFAGVPLRVREISFDVDRDGLLVNPSSCEPAQFDATFASDGEPPATATAGAPLQVTGCDGLPFGPKLRISVGASGQTAARSHPPLVSVVEQREGDAAIRTARVTLPDVLRPNTTAINERICQEHELASGNCPAGSRVGSASAVTPLLPDALQGPVYLIQKPGQLLPILSVLLSGAASVRVDGQTALNGLRTTTTFDGLPDVPVTRFELSLDGGPSGILSAFDDLCDSPPASLDAVFTGHNGAQLHDTPRLEVEGCDAAGLRASVVISRRSLEMTKRGRVAVRVSCARGGRDCDGMLTLRRTGPARLGGKSARPKSRALVLGRKRFSILAGGTRSVRVKLTGAGRRAVLRLRRTRVSLRAALAGGPTAKVATTLRAPRRGVAKR